MKNQKRSIFLAAMLSSLFHPSTLYAYDILWEVADYAVGLYEKKHFGVFNMLDYDMWEFLELEFKFEPGVVRTLDTEEDLLEAVHQCAFLREGFYDHFLTEEQWHLISGDFTQKLLSGYFNSDEDEQSSDDFSYIAIDKPFVLGDIARKSSPCALGIVAGDEVLLLQGLAVE